MTFPHIADSVFTERDGILAVASTVNRARCLWRETPMHDVGVDGQIEYVDAAGNATGRLVLVQVKSGSSYFKRQAGTRVLYTPALKHSTYWERAPLPVILVLHREDIGLTCWTDARAQLRSGNSVISVDSTRPFDQAGLLTALAQDGPLPTGAGAPDDLIRLLLRHRSASADFPVDFFDLFVHGTLELNRVLFFGMELATQLAQATLSNAEAEVGMALTSSEYDFLLEYVNFLVAFDLARIDYDNFRRLWDEQQFVCSFMAPLTRRGRAVIERISELEGPSAAPEVRVAQDKFFQGIHDFEIYRRVPVVENFKQRLPELLA